MDERSLRPDLTIPATRRAHSPNDGPLLGDFRFAVTGRFRTTVLAEEDEVARMA